MREVWAAAGLVLIGAAAAGQPPAVVKVRTIGTDEYGRVTRAEFGPDSKTVYAAIGSKTAAYDIATGAVRAEYKALKNTFGPIAAMPTDGLLVRGFFDFLEISGPADTIFAKTRLKCQGDVAGVAASPDGKRVAGIVWKTKSVEVWDTTAGKRLQTLTGPTGTIATAVFSPDSTAVAAVDTGHTVTVWDVATGKAVATLAGGPGRKEAGAGPLAFSPDGKTVYGPGAGGVKLVAWDLAAGKKRWEADNPKKFRDAPLYEFDAVVAHPDGKRLVASTSDGDGKVWVFLDAADGKVTGEFKVSRRVGDGAPRMSPDGKWIAIGTFNGLVEVYEVK